MTRTLARVVARYGGYYASHVRDEEDSVLSAWREVLDVGRAAGLGQGGTQQDGDKGKQAAPGKDQGETGTEKREAGTGTDRK